MDIATTQIQRTLSTRPKSSTSLPRSSLRTIGLGSCGSVFEVPNTDIAWKKGTQSFSIWTDFCLTNRVHNAIVDVGALLQQIFLDAIIPRTPLCHSFHTSDDGAFWTPERINAFPWGHRTQQALFTVDRIPPVPKEARESLIGWYFADDHDVRVRARDDPDNEDCLIRVYLGERESTKQQEEPYDSLRNFPMRLNMFEDQGFDVKVLARQMAIGLAIMHWQAQVNGMDTEFVLGSAAGWLRPEKGYDNLCAGEHTVLAPMCGPHSRRSVHLWMLDFDKASPTHLTRQDVDAKLVPAFLGNDPYYPMPHVDKELWEGFRNTYLTASDAILQARGFGDEMEVIRLPRRFLEEVDRRLKETESWNERDNIVFEN